MNTEKYTYTEDDVAKGASLEVLAFKEAATPCNAQAILFAGQPAVGKSVVTAMLDRDFYIIDADDYRIYHPKYHDIERLEGKEAPQYTGKFAGAVCESVIDQLTRQGANVIIQGTGRNFETPHTTASLLKQKGYHIDLYVVACPIKVSTASIFKRYYEMSANGETGRFSNIEHTKTVLNALPENVDRLYESHVFDNMYIVNRANTALWSNTHPAKASQVLIQEFLRPLTLEEEEWITATKKLLTQTAPNPQAEIQAMDKAIESIYAYIKEIYS